VLPQPRCRRHHRIGRPEEPEYLTAAELERPLPGPLAIVMGIGFEPIVGVDRLEPLRMLRDADFELVPAPLG
jgi:hypothetical protein